MKKTFDTESMYNKIMPSSTHSDDTQNTMHPSFSDKSEDLASSAEETFPSEHRVVLRNIMEILVKEKTELAFEKIECCKCEKCLNSIYAMALNQLSPQYVAGTEEDIKRNLLTYSSTNIMEVNTVVLRSVLSVKKDPPH